MVEYDAQILRRLWDVEEEICRVFARICEKHHLRWFAVYGTALGAVRHQGFIPWDDDMDFGMPREDYETFLRVAPEELDERYAVLEPRTTKDYVLPFAKLTRSDSTFIEATDQYRTYHSGIYIDIFPFDPICADQDQQKKILNKCWLFYRLMVLSSYGKPRLRDGLSRQKEALLRLACQCGHAVLRMTGQTTLRLYRRYLNTITSSARSGKCEMYVDAMQYRAVGYEEDSFILTEEQLLPAVPRSFDGMELMLPHDPEGYLCQVFGDYMQLPPPEKRHCHTPSKLEFPEKI